MFPAPRLVWRAKHLMDLYGITDHMVRLEGGYAATYAPYCSAAIAGALLDPSAEFDAVEEPWGPHSETMPTSRTVSLDCDRALERATTVLRRYWRL